MKIDDALKVNPGLATGNTDAKASKPSEVAPKPEQSNGEKVTLSARSSEMQSLDSAVAASEAYDAAKVEAIKSAIVSGQFKIDSEKVADGLINTVKDLLSGQKA